MEFLRIAGQTGGGSRCASRPQEQTTAVAGDRSPVKLCPDLASLLGMNSKDKLVTLSGRKAVLLLGTISFQTKELCHEATAFFY
jgi:hypothetical protein